MSRSIEKTLITGISVAIVTVLAIVLVSIWQYRRIQDSGATIRHTNQVLSQTHEVTDISARYELAVKNYLLTGDSLFIDSLGVLDDRLHDRIAGLKELTTDNPLHEGRIRDLTHYVDRNRELLQQAIGLRRGDDFDGAARLIAGSATHGYSFQIRSLCDRMASEESGTLDQRRQANRRRTLELNIVLWSLMGAVLVLGIIFLKKVRVDLARERAVREELSWFNAALEDRVHRQTAELQGSEEKYRSLFYKSPLPKWIYDQDSLQFLEVNEAAIAHYGYSQEEFGAMTIRDIRPPEDHAMLEKDVEEARRSSDSYQQRAVWRHIKKDGDIIDVEITAHSFIYEGRQARMVVVNDITQRRRSEQLLHRLNMDLQKRAAELAASNSELERFAYIASHDLQEPLRMVSSFLQLLQKRYSGKLDERADQYIHYAVDGAERMKALILDLLEYSRAGTGKEEFSAVEMDEVMEEVGNIFRERIAEGGARVEAGPLPVVRGDKVQLTQLIQNLVSNALKYHSNEPAVIRIRAEESAHHWTFIVQDNGIGIDPLFFDKIFIIFQRLHNKSEYSGTGIGLAICKKIVERHGGRIWVEPAPEGGSIFFFTITKQP